MVRTLPKFTYEDYLLLPEDKRYELIGGDLMMVPSPGFKHQEILLKLVRLLADFVEKNDLGRILIAPFDVVLSSFDVVQPDLIFVSQDRLSIITEQNIDGPPDLVIEILSSDQNKDRIIKKKLYAKHGIKEYWLVDPEAKNIEVMILKEEGYQTISLFTSSDTLTSPTFPKLSLPLSNIFPLS